jgi:hypothetical protein
VSLTCIKIMGVPVHIAHLDYAETDIADAETVPTRG